MPVGWGDLMLQWALVVFGLTTIITQSKLFAPIRRGFKNGTGSKFIECPMCVGFWVGFGLSIFPGLSLGGHLLVRWLTDGFASSGLNWLLYVILVRLGAKGFMKQGWEKQTDYAFGKVPMYECIYCRVHTTSPEKTKILCNPPPKPKVSHRPKKTVRIF
jgi:hypothetical protein